MTPLRERFIQDLQLRNRAPDTIDAYVHQVARFAQHFGRSPTELGPEELRQYQLLLLGRKVSWSTYNQCVCALRFLYGTTLGRPELMVRLPYGRRPKKLPVVLSQGEVLELLGWVRSRRDRVVLTTMYATGMRVREASQLGVADIDSRRMTILVRRGKGNKQRLVPLSGKLLTELRAWWATHRNPTWLFPGSRPDRPLGESCVQKACQVAVARAGLKAGTCTHALRHTFATELLEAGVDLLTIQKILGHTSLNTTAIYTHVRRDHLQAVAQVLDLLPLEQLCGERPRPETPGCAAGRSDGLAHLGSDAAVASARARDRARRRAEDGDGLRSGRAVPVPVFAIWLRSGRAVPVFATRGRVGLLSGGFLPAGAGAQRGVPRQAVGFPEADASGRRVASHGRLGAPGRRGPVLRLAGDVLRDGLGGVRRAAAGPGAGPGLEVPGPLRVPFLRRFLQHVVPPHFVRIRSFGFLASCHRKPKLALIRRRLGVQASASASAAPSDEDPDGEPVRATPRCPYCGHRVLRPVGSTTRPSRRQLQAFLRPLPLLDGL